MQIPTSLRIFGKDYTVEFESRLNSGTNLEYGHIDYNFSKIKINPDYGEQAQQEALIHEIVHGIDDALSLDMGEACVHRFAVGLYAVIKDNPDIFK